MIGGLKFDFCKISRRRYTSLSVEKKIKVNIVLASQCYVLWGLDLKIGQIACTILYPLSPVGLLQSMCSM